MGEAGKGQGQRQWGLAHLLNVLDPTLRPGSGGVTDLHQPSQQFEGDLQEGLPLASIPKCELQ